MATATSSSHTVQINGLACRYLQWGEADAPPVLLLHGLRSYARTWEPIAQALSGSHLLIAPDFRGRGESAWDPLRAYRTDTYVSDIESFTAVLGLDRFAIVGHSMGGTVAYTCAARHPDQVAALVIEDIGPGSSTDTSGAERILSEMADTPPRFGSMEEVRAYWRGIRPDITEEALASRIDNTVRPARDGGFEWRLDMAGIAEARRTGDPAGAVDLWSCVEALRCPTLVIRGARSDFLPVGTCEQMAQRQPLLRWTQVPEAGHYVHDDNPEAFTDLVRRFLAEQLP
jgi:pimeloyl-ACP methyl ester carboxylesterase